MQINSLLIFNKMRHKNHIFRHIRNYLVVALLLFGTAISGQVGIQTNTPDASSALDIVSTNRGLLIPRVTLTSNLNNASPVTSPATGLMVFNSGANQPIGFYYWNGSAWTAVGGSGSGSNYWSLTGDAGTNPSTNFIGTTDNVSFVMKVNNIIAGQLSPDRNDEVSFGRSALIGGSGDRNTAMGYYALSVNTGSYNTSVGNYALRLNSSGRDNTATGYESLTDNTTGRDNSAFGSGALENISTGSYNTAVGSQSGPSSSNLSNTTSLGYNAVATANNQVRLGDANVTSLVCEGAYAASTANGPNVYVNASGQIMRSTTGGAGWLLTGNSGTTVGTHFIGTTDSEDLAIYTDDTERMRFTEDGQGLVGLTSAYAAEDFFSIEGNATQYYALNVYSPNGTSGYFDAAAYGIISFSGNSSYASLYGKNTTSSSYGGYIVGSNRTAYTVTGRYTGLSSHGDDGLFTLGQSTSGIGIIAGGNNVSTLSTLGTGAGGAFTGYHGLYSKATNSSEGVGVIGVGNNGSTYHTTSNGSGGAFTGYHGLIGHATDTDDGTGVIGVGDDGSYYLYYNASSRQGSGGAFTGNWCGAAGWATSNNNNSVGVYGYYDGTGSSRDGKGVIGIAAANSGRGYGVYGQGNRYGLYANGNSGASGTKSFEIDHPIYPEEKTLKHYSIESPEVLNLYRGVVNLDYNGNANITLPEYFIEININFSYTLTPIGQQAPNLYISQEIDDNGNFEISGGNPGQKISWVVYAERNDLFMQQYKSENPEIVEIEKDREYKGKYIMPELYNQPAENGMFYNQKGVKLRRSQQQSTDVKLSEAKNDVNKKDLKK